MASVLGGPAARDMFLLAVIGSQLNILPHEAALEKSVLWLQAPTARCALAIFFLQWLSPQQNELR